MNSDRIGALNEIASWYSRNGFLIRMNDGRMRSHPLFLRGRRLEPPLIVSEGDRLVRFIDVETSASLDGGAPLRWELSAAPGIPLHVYVPQERLEYAWSLRTALSATWPKLLTYDTSILNRDAGGRGSHGSA